MSRIDVHHHVQSPYFTSGQYSLSFKPFSTLTNTAAMTQAGCSCSVPNWNLADDRSQCTRMGVHTAILSHTAPGPEIEKDPLKAAALARSFNEFCAQIRDSDPQHYSFFASVPSLLDTTACLSEIEYAFDVLHADGVVLMTSYFSSSPGKIGEAESGGYLGHPAFEPVWAELNRRRAVVLVHPTFTPHLASAVSAALPPSMLDFPHETARAALDLVVGGTLRRKARECKIILSHGGGTLPAVVERVAALYPLSAGATKSAEDIREEVGWFYFDTALCSAPEQLAALKRIARPGHVLFGSDAPNAPVKAVSRFTEQLETSGEVSGEEKEEIDGDAARTLFPRLWEQEPPSATHL